MKKGACLFKGLEVTARVGKAHRTPPYDVKSQTIPTSGLEAIVYNIERNNNGRCSHYCYTEESHLVRKVTGEDIPSLFSSLRFYWQSSLTSILEPFVMVYSFNTNTWERESGGLGIQVQLWSYR